MHRQRTSDKFKSEYFCGYITMVYAYLSFTMWVERRISTPLIAYVSWTSRIRDMLKGTEHKLMSSFYPKKTRMVYAFSFCEVSENNSVSAYVWQPWSNIQLLPKMFAWYMQWNFLILQEMAPCLRTFVVLEYVPAAPKKIRMVYTPHFLSGLQNGSLPAYFWFTFIQECEQLKCKLRCV